MEKNKFRFLVQTQSIIYYSIFYLIMFLGIIAYPKEIRAQNDLQGGVGAGIGTGIGSFLTQNTDAREEHPLQLQYGLSIVFFPLSEQPRSFSVGYHITDFIYLGILTGDGSALPHKYKDDAFDQEGLENQKAVERDNYNTLQLRANIRGTAYLALGYFQKTGSVTKFKFDNRSRQIGNNHYVTDLTVTIENPKWKNITLGFGASRVLQNGISFDFGIHFISYADSPQLKVEAKASNPNVSGGDLEAFEEDVKNSFSNRILEFPYFAFLGIGYNF